MRNFRKANVTRKTVTIALLLPILVASAQLSVKAQESEGPVLGLIESDSVLVNRSPQETTSSDAPEDKWALTDEDRMTDEEMDQELFGNGLKSTDASEANGAGESAIEIMAPRDEESLSPKNDREDNVLSSKKKQVRLAARPTIESYLRNINSLTIDTYTPPATSLDRIDVPQRKMPPQQIASARSAIATDMRFQTPDIYHRPLYFEDASVERYGMHSCRRQPLASARKFVSDSISLPREIRNQPPGSCVHRVNPRYNTPSLIPSNR